MMINFFTLDYHVTPTLAVTQILTKVYVKTLSITMNKTNFLNMVIGRWSCHVIKTVCRQ